MASRTAATYRLANIARQGWYVLAATVLMTTQPFITTLSKNAEGNYDYSPISTTFLVEMAKFAISLAMYAILPSSTKTHTSLGSADVILFAVPALLYAINNNLIFYILMYVNVSTFQILSSLKTVFTGLLFRLVLKRILSDIQASSILLLACGAAVSQFPICSSSACSSGVDGEGKQQAMSTAIFGALLALLASLLSAFAGVYSELLLKRDAALHSIHLQNLLLCALHQGGRLSIHLPTSPPAPRPLTSVYASYLRPMAPWPPSSDARSRLHILSGCLRASRYAWGVGLNGAVLIVKDRTRLASGDGGLFKGYSPIVCLLIANNALVRHPTPTRDCIMHGQYEIHTRSYMPHTRSIRDPTCWTLATVIHQSFMPRILLHTCMP